MLTLSTTLATVDSTLCERPNSTAKHVTDQFETSSLNNRLYRVIILENLLKVLLVHDAETDKASAAMDVNVGSFSNLPETPRIAHGAEHMLLIRTKKE